MGLLRWGGGEAAGFSALGGDAASRRPLRTLAVHPDLSPADRLPAVQRKVVLNGSFPIWRTRTLCPNEAFVFSATQRATGLLAE